MEAERIAQVCHEVNRAYCEATGDYTQVGWLDVEQWQRDSAIAGVLHRLSNHGAHWSASHDSWLEHKRKDGWRWGPVKDAEKKEHPCCVPYEMLPEYQKIKDHLFVAVVESLRNEA